MKLQYLGHSCFRVEAEGYEIVLDPYEKDSVPGLKPLDVEADQCLCSHGHKDHCGLEWIHLKNRGVESPFRVERLESWHDGEKGTQRGSNAIHILQAEGLKIIHLGDLGCMPEKWQLERMMDADVILAPVGGYYTAEPEVIRELIGRLSPAVMIPMHYRTEKSGFPVLKTCEEYLKDCKNVTRYDTDTILLEAGEEGEKEETGKDRDMPGRDARPFQTEHSGEVRTVVLKQWALNR